MLECSLGENLKRSLRLSSASLQLGVAYQIHDLAASRRRRPADPGGKPARGAPSPGRLRATCRGLCSSWRCASSAESHTARRSHARARSAMRCGVFSPFEDICQLTFFLYYVYEQKFVGKQTASRCLNCKYQQLY